MSYHTTNINKIIKILDQVEGLGHDEFNQFEKTLLKCKDILNNKTPVKGVRNWRAFK